MMYTIIQISIIALNYGKEIMNYAVFYSKYITDIMLLKSIN